MTSKPCGPDKPALGFSIRVFGRELPSHDARPWPAEASLSMSLACVRDIMLYLRANGIHMYRLHSGVLPYSSERTLAELLQEIAYCHSQLAEVGALARMADIRLSFHPYSAIVLNALNEEQAQCSSERVTALAALLDAMDLGPEAVIVLHVGGVYDDPQRARERFVRRYEALPPQVKERLALEQDDRRFSHADTRWIHERCGIRLLFDNLHHLVLNPEGVPPHSALAYCLATWPPGVRPKIHFATPRTEMRLIEGTSRIKVPTWTEHSDFVNPFQFIAFLREMGELPPFDIMLEAKARDLALLKLRQDLARFAPDLAAHLC